MEIIKEGTGVELTLSHCGVASGCPVDSEPCVFDTDVPLNCGCDYNDY